MRGVWAVKLNKSGGRKMPCSLTCLEGKWTFGRNIHACGCVAMNTELHRKQIGHEMFEPPDLKGGGAITLDDWLKFLKHMATETVTLNQSKGIHRGEDRIQVSDRVHEGPAVEHGRLPAVKAEGVHDDTNDPVQEMFDPIRPELAGKNLPSQPPVRGDHVDKAPVVRGGVPDVQVEEVQDNQEVHHQVDAWQADQAVAVHDDVPTGGGGDDDQDRWRLVENVTKDAEPNGGSARSKRSPKPKPMYSPDDYDLS
jgi:hypothetical protein